MIVFGKFGSVHNFLLWTKAAVTFALGHPGHSISRQILANSSYPKLAQVVHLFWLWPCVGLSESPRCELGTFYE